VQPISSLFLVFLFFFVVRFWHVGLMVLVEFCSRRFLVYV